MTETYHTDALIIGGGVAGLWLLNRLRNDGFEACLLEQDSLGAGQSIASQGMIHGGIKYALGGSLTRASTTIADMPAHWKNCLAGTGDVDLRGCGILSEHYYMWPGSSLRSRLTAFLGSKAVVGRVARVAPSDYPRFFRGHIDGPLYRLQDIVLDLPSLLRTLRDRQEDRIFLVDWERSAIIPDPAGGIARVELNGQITIQASRYILCCGAGAEGLMKKCNREIAPMQRRPLQMVMVKHGIADPLFVHCVSGKLSTTPELTITSHRNGNGEPVWYLGGELAEWGAAQTPETLVEAAQKKLTELFPWCDFSTASWHTLAIDRAEARQADGRRPDDVSITGDDNLLVCWPTKLTLAPVLAAQVAALLKQQGITPAPGGAVPDLSLLPRPGIAATPWETL